MVIWNGLGTENLSRSAVWTMDTLWRRAIGQRWKRHCLECSNPESPPSPARSPPGTAATPPPCNTTRAPPRRRTPHPPASPQLPPQVPEPQLAALDHVPQHVHVELRRVLRVRERPRIDHHLDPLPPQQLQELLHAVVRMPDRVHAQSSCRPCLIHGSPPHITSVNIIGIPLCTCERISLGKIGQNSLFTHAPFRFHS